MTTTPLRLLLAACQYPAGVLDRTPVPTLRWKHPLTDRPPAAGPADATREAMQRWASMHGTPDAYLWAGDWIYIDATAGLFDPLSHEDGRSPRSRAAILDSAYADADRSPVKLPGRWLRSVDDHEIDDNWEPSAHAKRRTALHILMQTGRDAYLRSSAADHRPAGTNTLWFTDRLGDVPVFVADTRTERECREPASALERARIMSDMQWQVLSNTLAEAARSGSTPLVLCGSILLPRRLTTAQHPRGALRSDAWDGYPASFHDLLATLAELCVPGCLFLSGDEHLACAVEARVERTDDPARSAAFWSVHAGAAYAPYPFANGRPEHFADESGFEFGSAVCGLPRRYRCTLTTVFGPIDSDGFISVELTPRRSAAVPAPRPRVVWHAAYPPASYPLMSPAGFGVRSSTA